jgi:azurin
MFPAVRPPVRFSLRALLGASLVGLLAALPVAVRAAEAPTVIRIASAPGLKFDLSAFSVRPGAEVEVIFSNTEEMLHNFVIVKPGTREAVGQAALMLGAGAAERDFVPPSPDVLFATKVVPAGTSVSLKFSAPTELGDYPYVCTFPGHYVLMFGTMIVTNNPQPPVKTPMAVVTPAATGTAPSDPATVDHSAHMAAAERAVTQRAFMPNAGPASIGIQLPGGVSYCWDTGAVRFRYAWTGGFMTKPTTQTGNEVAERGLTKLQGTVFYTEVAYPLRLGNTAGAEPKLIAFKGYTLDAQRIPEFETVVDGVTVRERVEVKDGKLVRRFRSSGEATVWFAIADGANQTATGGTREGNYFKFSGAAAKEFSITMPLPAPAPAQ